MAKKLLENGVTSFCPTLITSPTENYSKLVPQCRRTEGGAHGAAVLGLHLEGPFINKAKKGAHPEKYIKDYGLGVDEDSATAEVDDNETVSKKVSHAIDSVYPVLDPVSIVTLAPEIPGALEATKFLAARGIKVSMGHSRSDLDTAAHAVVSGASMITHLFNAMAAFHHRDPGIVGLVSGLSTALAVPHDTLRANTQIYYGVIVDGFHTHPSALKMAHSTYPEGCVLVTDAMAAMGLDPGSYKLGEIQVSISQEHKATVEGSPEILAGSTATMVDCVRNFAKIVGLPAALDAATVHPAKALGIDDQKGTLESGRDADLVLMDDEGNVHATYIKGRLCWSGDEHAAAVFYSPHRGGIR